MRSFTSLLTTFSFLTMTGSGLIAFVMPQGRIAFWNNWALLGLDKTAWGNIHIATSLLFLIAGILHTCLNWRALLNYLSGGRKPDTRSRGPLWAALLLTVFFSIGAVVEPPPFKQLFNFNTWVKDTWVTSPAQNPPFGHAELNSLADLCGKQKIDLEEALTKLMEMGLKGISAEATLQRIATLNQRSPDVIYHLIKPLPTTGEKQIYTAELVVQQHEGIGVGRNTLDEICQKFSITPQRAAAKLAEQGWSLESDETIKTAAKRLGVSPMTIIQTIMLGEKII